MHLQFLPYLADPETHQPLELEPVSILGDHVETGFLKGGSRNYPIIRGIPRFVEHESDNYSRSFGYEWHRWPKVQFESSNIGKPMEGHTRQMWEIITGLAHRNAKIEGTVIADIGCGAGRFIDVVRSKGAKVIAIDFSNAAEIASQNFKDDANVCVCQADALHLPFKTDSIDAAFSIGVLHHTPDPSRGVNEAYRVLRDRGWFALCVYEKGGYYDLPAVQRWRKIFKYLWPLFRHYPPLTYTHLTVRTLRPLCRRLPRLKEPAMKLAPFVDLPDIDWSLLDTFDSVTPSYQSAHEGHEVRSWMKEAGFFDIEPTNWGSTSYCGIKRACCPTRLCTFHFMREKCLQLYTNVWQFREGYGSLQERL